MPYAFGDIYLVDHDPSAGHEYKGKRPAIVIQQEEVSKYSPVITVMSLTSQLDQLRHYDILMQEDTKNRLNRPSVIKVQHIRSFDKQRFIFKIGMAGSPVIRGIRGYLRRHFGL
ncbi:type II toxin-antitoxin system PemK/MazF family toxin [Candidatus Peregrinibacteria bacterium]|nr:type II toxin-antitoxin system PemK/MazF family toxin [Candidatus Peregrinibacteria bacterium]